MTFFIAKTLAPVPMICLALPCQMITPAKTYNLHITDIIKEIKEKLPSYSSRSHLHKRRWIERVSFEI